ncbi:helix-turn-helix domain-containing protein [Miltoncostaea marina]|uniref:helix-turn-helix domain-containing protein n=1 Tax=Miltoncostaea marina TaxID=2843215 RepID=UPI001C3C248F|nr:helix-turn-helix domain-containing protein [Miltoncostaea marina]
MTPYRQQRAPISAKLWPMSEPPPHEVLNLPEVADWLGLHPNSVHRAARSGRLPARRVGKEWRFLREAVAARWTPGRRLRGKPSPGTEGQPAVPVAPIALSAQEAADFLRIELHTFYHEAMADRLPAWKEGNEWRTDEGALRDYLRQDPDADTRYVKERASRAGS